MTEEEAKEVIRDDPGGDSISRIEAIHVALRVLGQTATMGEIYRWAERNDDDGERVSETVKKS